MPPFTKKQITAFHHALHRWYNAYGRRDLPWRNTDDPYAIYISEVMLQQTQVKTVLERYYAPFLKKFPTLAALAGAEGQAVAKQWEGLGYYSRAANLQKSAKQCAGKLPQTRGELQALPGIGRNTASAVACFAFKQPVPVMEANVRRILCRVFAMEQAQENSLWEKAEQLLDKKNPFDYNQAMMDIGALICTKRSPRCDECPLNTLCLGKASPTLYPAPKPAKATPVRERIIVAIRDTEGGYYVQRRETRFLHGLYGFYEYPVGTDSVAWQNKMYTLADIPVIGQVTQTYSHFTLHASVRILTVAMAKKNTSNICRTTLANMRELPLSGADHKVLAILERELEQSP